MLNYWSFRPEKKYQWFYLRILKLSGFKVSKSHYFTEKLHVAKNYLTFAYSFINIFFMNQFGYFKGEIFFFGPIICKILDGIVNFKQLSTKCDKFDRNWALTSDGTAIWSWVTFLNKKTVVQLRRQIFSIHPTCRTLEPWY